VNLGPQLERARRAAGFTQDDVAASLGVSRAMISYWEANTRVPNEVQLAALASLYRRQPNDFYETAPIDEKADEARMLYRRAAVELTAAAQRGIGAFVDFLADYAKLADQCGVNLRGMTQSPFLLVPGFESADDARRKAEEVRAHLRIGLGPVADVDKICEQLGITVYRSQLGNDLSKTISGAFFNHPRIGFSILVNLDMTPGRRRFTLAHELGHALLHSDGDSIVVSGPKRDAREKFADIFAGEFLMPSEGIRRAIEEFGAGGPRIDDPADVIHLQRYFNVSYVTALVRLRQARLLTKTNFERFKSAQPVAFAAHLGYEIDDEEYQQDPHRWRIDRFPIRFLRLVRQAIRSGVISPSTASTVMGLTIAEVTELASDDTKPSDPKLQTEWHEYEVTEVLVG
jgi:Zn-dependent peptidase ImmA (M78 family)/DNA-binding XRE family transcriptional regulator